MKDINKLPKDFFTKINDNKKNANNKDNEDKYAKIEEIKWNKDVLAGKRKIVGTLPKDNKML